MKSLAELKRRLKAGCEFEITAHCRVDCVGEIRKITKADTQGFYSILPAEPDNSMNRGNGGLGSWLGWSKAVFWHFDGSGVCALYSSDKQHTPEHLIIAFRLL